MTTTEDDRRGSPAATPTVAAAVPVPPKIRRRPALMAGGVTAICLGALLAVWAWTATTHTQEVLAARVTIYRGQVITAADLERVEINRDPAVSSIPASAFSSIVGQHAALDVGAGGLLTTSSTTSSPLPPQGQSVVGISLAAAQLPAVPLVGGDHVRVIVTPGPNGQAPLGAPAFTQAQVIDTHVDPTSGNTVVDVLVPYADASVLAARAATGQVALVLDSNSSGGN